MGTPVNRSVDHLHKLEKKHSCGDLLHNRLKSRKLLGVGQTPDGDVYRSKLSQILGHNEQLYARGLPWGLNVWRYVNILAISGTAITSLLFPRCSLYYQLSSPIVELATEGSGGGGGGGGGGDGWGGGSTSLLPYRLHGTALLALSVLLWKTIPATEPSFIRLTLLAGVVYWPIDVTLTLLSVVMSDSSVTAKSFRIISHLGLVTGLAAANSFYYYRLRQQRPTGAIPSNGTTWTSKQSTAGIVDNAMNESAWTAKQPSGDAREKSTGSHAVCKDNDDESSRRMKETLNSEVTSGTISTGQGHGRLTNVTYESGFRAVTSKVEVLTQRRESGVGMAAGDAFNFADKKTD